MALAGKITLAVITVDTPMNRRKVSIVWPNESIIADGYSLKQMGENEGSTFTLYVNQAVANTLRGKAKTVSGVVVPVLTVGPLLGDAELKTAQMVNGKDFSIMTRFLHGTGIDLYIAMAPTADLSVPPVRSCPLIAILLIWASVLGSSAPLGYLMTCISDGMPEMEFEIPNLPAVPTRDDSAALLELFEKYQSKGTVRLRTDQTPLTQMALDYYFVVIALSLDKGFATTAECQAFVKSRARGVARIHRDEPASSRLETLIPVEFILWMGKSCAMYSGLYKAILKYIVEQCGP